MKSFTDWYIELIEDERWHEQASMHHSPKTFEETARKVFVLGITEPTFERIPMSEHRKHVYNKILKITPDKVKKNWWEKAQEGKTVEPVKQEPVLTGEERKMRLNEWYEAVQKASTVNAIPPMSRKEIQENGGWRPKPVEVREPSELEKAAALNAHIEKINAARRKLFLDAYPEAPEEEILAYIKSFEKI
jgi:hypothetical protein